MTVSDKAISLLSRISIDNEHKSAVYDELDKLENTAVIDRGYFSSKMLESTSEDFNYILLVSSLIVFFALLLSYGRIELTLLTFLPMAISWIIILIGAEISHAFQYVDGRMPQNNNNLKK